MSSLEHREGQPYHVYPTGPVADVGHVLGDEDPSWFTTDGPELDGCYLCERGVCVRRVVQMGHHETLIVHGAYEA